MNIDFILIGMVLFLAILILLVFIPLAFGAPFQPIPKERLKKIMKLANINQGMKVADIGSGNGKIVIALAKAGAEAHGFEINPFLVWLSKRRIKKEGLQMNAFIQRKNFWKVDFSKFDVVTIFQVHYVMSGLKKKIQRELKNNSKIISNDWRFPDWKPEKEDGKVYLYRIKK